MVFDSDYFDTDAVSFNWTNFTPDICSSFRLIGKIMDKSMLDRCNRGSYHYSSLEITVLISIIEPNLISIPTRLSRQNSTDYAAHERVSSLGNEIIIDCFPNPVVGLSQTLKRWFSHLDRPFYRDNVLCSLIISCFNVFEMNISKVMLQKKTKLYNTLLSLRLITYNVSYPSHS